MDGVAASTIKNMLVEPALVVKSVVNKIVYPFNDVGEDISRDERASIDELEYSIRDNLVSDKVAYDAGRVLGDVGSAAFGVYETANGLATMVTGASEIVGGVILTGPTAGAGAGVVAAGAGTMAMGTAITAHGLVTARSSLVNMQQNSANFKKSVAESKASKSQKSTSNKTGDSSKPTSQGSSSGGGVVEKAEKNVGDYLANKAPNQVTPGTRILEVQYVDDLGRIQPWRAHYDKYGRLIGRTDYNALNKKAGIPDTHYHTYEWGPGKAPLESGSHIEGVYKTK